MLQPDCEPLMQTIQSFTQDIEEIDFRIGALEAEAMELNPLQYLVAQRRVDSFLWVKHARRDKWDNAMSQLASCRSTHPAHHNF